ncbi:MAG: hypothetical protein HN742_41955 [Lentisphaerae bacterium]|jgi:hypothetical protein|nr:hypothetical protein [Lentisphaerota bacterium]MBT4815068.1 hypothetical protein [Lentisphaerota bacterium]MBT5610114.1 hypothetical protein [Lentisphaerota bacterium]MBT7053594.1 hypothetical protein [Lentisphaerota bacterium]MBT7848503.1 hypothetical protein [Lentisphaerota bacterium]
MSRWLEAACGALSAGAYGHFREDLLPICPIPVPGCLTRELTFAERCCRDREADRLFPIRFYWLLEANEQRLGDYPAMGYSRYHPEKLLEFWQQAEAVPAFRAEKETEGFRFDFEEKAVDFTVGWIYIGDSFVDDLICIEETIGVELLFPTGDGDTTQSIFRDFKARRKRGPA